MLIADSDTRFTSNRGPARAPESFRVIPGLGTDRGVGKNAPRNREDSAAPVLTARRRAIQILGNKEAVSILFDTVAPRFEERPGGYTRIMRLAKPRLGDGGIRVILEFVGERDRIKVSAPEPIQVEREEPELDETLDSPEDSVSEVTAEADVAETDDAKKPESESE